MKRIKIKNEVNSKLNLKNLRMYVLSGICGILAVLSIFMTIQSASTGAEIASIQKEAATLITQRQDLEASLVENLSINSLQEKSVGMGFTKITNLVYVTGSVPVARLPQ